MTNSSNMNNYAASMPTTKYTPEYIPENGYDFGDDQSLPMSGQYQRPQEGLYAPSTINSDLQSLSPAYYLSQHFGHSQQHPRMGETPQQYIYQPYEEQQAWHTQSQAVTKQFNPAPTVTQPRKSGYQSSTAASRARESSVGKDLRAQQIVSIFVGLLYHPQLTIY